MADITELIQTLNSKNTQPQPTVDDVSSLTFDMSPEEQQAFDEQMGQQPSTGLLPQNAYYPGYNSNIAVGSSSGSEIGSQTIFAPNAALVPIGMMDARDAAVQRAAMQRAQEVSKFKEQFTKAPTSKLVNINEDLSNKYINLMQGGWQKALKAAKNDPNLAMQMIKNNPEFLKKKKAIEDFAIYGDSIVGQVAKNQEMSKTGDFIYTPSLKKAERGITSISSVDDPNFKNFGNYVRSYRMEEELAKDMNMLIKDAKMSKAASAGIDTNNPEALRAWERSTQFYSPELIESVTNELITSRQGSEIYTPQKIKEAVQGALSAQIKDYNQSVTKRDEKKGVDVMIPFKPVDEAKKYNIKVPEKSINSGTSTYREAEISGYDAQPIPQGVFKNPIITPKGRNMIDAETGTPYVTTGTEEMMPTEVINLPYLKGTAAILSDDQLKEGIKGKDENIKVKEAIDVRPTVVFNIPVKSEALFGDPSKTTGYKTVYAPLDEWKGTLKNIDADAFKKQAAVRTKELQGRSEPKAEEKKTENFRTKYKY